MMWIRPQDHLCTGCQACRVACAQQRHHCDELERAAIGIRPHPQQEGRYLIVVCNQCGLCEVVCPVGAIRKDGGVYRVFPECTGCLYCVEVCPLHCIYVHPEVPEVIKCDACAACLSACPVAALTLER